MPQALGQVANPPRGSTGFHDHEVDLLAFQHRREVIAFGRCVQEPVFPRLGVEKAAHGIEFAEIQSENVHA